MPDTNEHLAKLGEARAIMEENLVVIANIEKRHAEFIKAPTEGIAEFHRSLKEQAIKNKETDERIEKLVAAIDQLPSRSS